MNTRVFKPEEKYAWQALNHKKHIWFFFQNYELWLKYEIEKKFISSIFTGHDLEQNTF